MRTKRIVLCSAITLIAMLFVCGCTLFDGGDAGGKCNLGGLILTCNSGGEIIYDGSPKRVEIIVRDQSQRRLAVIAPNGESEDFDVTYENNVNAGTATVTVTAKKTSATFAGSATLTFDIKGMYGEANDFETLSEMAGDGNYSTVKLTGEITVGEGEVLTVEKNTTVDCNSFRLINNGKIINRGFISVRETPEKTDFENASEIENEGRIVLYSARLLNRGKIDGSGEITSGGAGSSVYTDSDMDKNGIGKGVSVYRRYSIDECTVSLEYYSADYTGSALVPSVIIESGGEAVDRSDYEVIYENNVNAGTASVTVIASENAEKIFGSKTLNFIIERSSVKVTKEADFISALENPNYREIKVGGVLLKTDFTVGADKTVYAETSTLYCSSLIKGKFVVREGATFDLNGSVTVEDGGEFQNEGTVRLKGSIGGAGTFTNGENGKIFVFEESNHNCAWTNNGTIFANDGQTVLAQGTGSVLYRQRLTDADASLQNSGEKYDGGVKFPKISFLTDTQPEGGTYSVTVYPKGSDESVSLPKDAGKYDVIVNFFGWSEQFCGSFVLDYEILPGECSVSTLSELSVALTSNNYETVTIDGTCTLTMDSPVTVPTGKELIISESVRVIDKYRLSVYGKITNYGCFAEGGADGNCITVYENGSFVNSGSAFFNGEIPEGVEGEGTFFVRKNINGAVSNDFAPEITYVLYGILRPAFTLKLDGTLLNDGNTDDYFVTGENCSDVSDVEPALAIVNASPFSEKVFGQKIMEYRILPGETSVDSLSELCESLGNVRPDSELCNWGKITLCVDIIERDPVIRASTLTVCKNTTLSLGEHALILNVETGYKLVNYGTIETWSTGINTLTYSGSGKILGFASDCETLLSMTGFCNEIVGFASDGDTLMFMTARCKEIYLKCDIESTDLMLSTGAQSCMIDLCGYTLNTCIKVNTEKAPLEIKNGTLGSLDKSPAVLGAGGKNSFVLRDLKIYGMNSGIESIAEIYNCEIV